MKKKFLECGKICSPHGVRGIVKVEPWCDSVSVLTGLKEIYFQKGETFIPVAVLGSSSAGATALMTLEGVDTREAAQGLKNTVIFAKREDIPIPKGRVLIADMIGLEVIDADTGRIYGTLTEVSDGVRHQIYTIKTDKGEVLFPAVKEFLEEIDTERGVFIRPIPGFFEDEV